MTYVIYFHWKLARWNKTFEKAISLMPIEKIVIEKETKNTSCHFWQALTFH